MRTVRILTIGNSFAANALTHLEAMAMHTPDIRVHIGRANLSGCSLEKHWNLATYTTRQPEHRTYQLGIAADGTPHETTLHGALRAAAWDVITLQQASWMSWRRETFEPYLSLLHGLARQLAPQAEIFLHQTWSYRADSPFLPQHGLTQRSMFERISDNYTHFSEVLNCRILPSGEAIQQARETPGRTFMWPDPDFDYQRAEAPALPRQEHALEIGWHWVINDTPEGIPELRLDAAHLNTHGCYLTGCVWLACLTGTDVRQLDYIPAGIDLDTAVFLREVAHDVSHRYTCRQM